MYTPDDTFILRGADGEEIPGDLYLPAHEGHAPVVILVHGFKGFKHWGFFPFLGRTLADAGFAAASISLSHCGLTGSTDVFNRLDLFERDTWGKRLHDLQQAVTASALGLLTNKRDLDGSRLALVGHSAGGGLCVLEAAKDRRVKALVTLAGISRPNRWSPDEYEPHLRASGAMTILNGRTGQEMRVGTQFFEEIAAHPQAFDILAAARSLTQPWLLVHGVDDESVPFDEARELLEAAGGNAVGGENARLLSIDNTGHAFGAQHPLKRRPPELVQISEAIIAHLRRVL
ncbi:MAG: alpha/beta fold hydrolase [Planctomycetes bacterium]|nr:alpha/beta fold hydrolase [Planctomycetota bacterium]